MHTYTRISISISVDAPAVLVPSLDLRVGQVELRRQLHAILHAQVLLALEAALEAVQLVVRERRARLARLLGLEGAVGVTAGRDGVIVVVIVAGVVVFIVKIVHIVLNGFG